MTIDIDNLTEAELIDLNNRVVAPLKLLHQMRSASTRTEPPNDTQPRNA